MIGRAAVIDDGSPLSVVELPSSSFVVVPSPLVVLGGAVCDGPPAVIEARDEGAPILLVEPDELLWVRLLESVVLG